MAAMDLVTYMMILFVAAVGIWQAVCVVVWIWDKVRRPEPEKAPEPDAIQRSLECIARDAERQKGNRKSA